MEIFTAKIVHYYSTIGVARITVSDLLNVGDHIHIKGNTTDFDQKVESLQVRHRQVSGARKGEIAGLKVKDYVRKNDRIYRVEESGDEEQ